jgi:hypothetical protein
MFSGHGCERWLRPRAFLELNSPSTWGGSVDKGPISAARFSTIHETMSRRRPGGLRIMLALLPLFAASTFLGQTKLSFESRIAKNGDGEAVITNHNNVPMVAWIFEVLREPCNPLEADRHIYEGYDSAFTPDGAALQPRASRAQNIGVSHCNKVGTQSPNRASLRVALFADGSSVGDSGWLEILRRDRRGRLQRIGRAIQALKELTGAQTREQCLRSLEKARDTLPRAEEPQVEYSIPDPLDGVVRELTDNQSAMLNNQIGGLLSRLEAERGHLERQQ